jgi:integrase
MIYRRGKWYWMDDTVNSFRYREPLRTANWQEALRLEKERIGEIQAAKGLNQNVAAKQTFTVAADAYVDRRKLFSAEKTYLTDKQRSEPLRKFFGDIRLKRITPEMIAEYQTKRTSDGISGRTVNLELGLLRRILKRAKQWARVADDVEMLPEKPKEARILSPDEKAKLIETAASKPVRQVAYCAAVLALNTTMRGCELRGLRWKDVNLFEKVLRIRRQSTKTDAGARVIPLNRDAVVALGELWDRSRNLGGAESEHFVFPACMSSHINPIKPMKGWRTAWRSLTKKAGLKGLRFHDLRHQAITELAETGLSDQTIMSIAGHVSREMLDHYSHIRLTPSGGRWKHWETPLRVNQAEGATEPELRPDHPEVRPN